MFEKCLYKKKKKYMFLYKNKKKFLHKMTQMLLVDKIMHLVKTQGNQSIHILLKQNSAMKKYSHMVALEQMKVYFTFV